MFRPKELSNFIKSALPNIQQQQKYVSFVTDSQNEEPLLLVPDNFKANQQHIEKIYRSYLNFIKKYDEQQRNANQNVVASAKLDTNFDESR